MNEFDKNPVVTNYYGEESFQSTLADWQKSFEDTVNKSGAEVFDEPWSAADYNKEKIYASQIINFEGKTFFA